MKNYFLACLTGVLSKRLFKVTALHVNELRDLPMVTGSCYATLEIHMKLQMKIQEKWHPTSSYNYPQKVQ